MPTLNDPAELEFDFVMPTLPVMPTPKNCPLCGGLAHAEEMLYSRIVTVFCACGLTITTGLDDIKTVIEKWNQLHTDTEDAQSELPY